MLTATHTDLNSNTKAVRSGRSGGAILEMRLPISITDGLIIIV